jgi:hypothetical protein
MSEAKRDNPVRGTMTAAVVVLLLAAAGGGAEAGSCQSCDLAVYDDFSGGLSKWDLIGKPWIDSEDGLPAPSFAPGGGASHNGNAFSVAWSPVSCLQVRADAHTPAHTNYNDFWVAVTIVEGISPHGVSVMAAGIVYPSHVNGVQFVLNGEVIGQDPVDVDTQWHNYGFAVRHDRRVEYYKDDLPVFVSSDPLDATVQEVRLMIGGRSHGAETRLDNVAWCHANTGVPFVMETFETTPDGEIPLGWLASDWCETPPFVTREESLLGQKSLGLDGFYDSGLHRP